MRLKIEILISIVIADKNKFFYYRKKKEITERNGIAVEFYYIFCVNIKYSVFVKYYFQIWLFLLCSDNV